MRRRYRFRRDFVREADDLLRLSAAPAVCGDEFEDGLVEAQGAGVGGPEAGDGAGELVAWDALGRGVELGPEEFVSCNAGGVDADQDFGVV